MDLKKVKESYYNAIENALVSFCQTKENSDIYALVFDCNSSIGQICLRYANLDGFKERAADFKQYADLYKPYGKLGLRGYKYDVGDFTFIQYSTNEIINNFEGYYYYYATGDFYWDWEDDYEPEQVVELEKDCRGTFLEIVLYCIQELKKKFSKLNVTDDFVIYMCDHDQSNEEKEDMIKQTVDEALFKKLLSESYL